MGNKTLVEKIIGFVKQLFCRHKFVLDLWEKGGFLLCEKCSKKKWFPYWSANKYEVKVKALKGGK